MCGRYTLATIDPTAVRARFPIGESVDILRRYNVAPGDDVLAVTTDREGAPRGELLQWGLVPPWAKTPGRRPINARAETVTERPTFRTAFDAFSLPDPRRRLLRMAGGPKRPERGLSHLVVR